MAKTIITIGSEYGDAFESICALVENGSVDAEVVERVDVKHTEIETAGHIFRYDPALPYIRTNEEIGMAKDGATWFKVFRGGKVDNDMATWHNLIERVASNYHKNYSLFECDHHHDPLTSAQVATYAQAGQRIVNALWGEIGDISVVEGDSEKGIENIYCVFLRASISGGTGEARPVLCKVFFRQEKNGFVPVERAEAETVASFLDELAEKTPEKKDYQTDGAMIDLALGALENLLYGEDETTFDKCVLIENSEDCETINAMVKNGPNEFVVLECSEIKPLGVAHVRWRNDSLTVTHEGKDAFYLTVSVNGKITLRCASCESDPIIRNNIIVAYDEDGAPVEFEIDANKANLGFGNADLEFIKRNSAVKDHYTKIQCPELRRRIEKPCVKFVCKVNAQNFGDDENPVLRCLDCPYPEVVYTDANGAKKLTKDLKFAFDKMDMVSAKNTFTCSVCGKTFTRAVQRKASGIAGEKFCPLCASVMTLQLNKDETPTQEQKETYERYKKALPLSVRAFTPSKRKFAIEREDVIMFVLDDKVYRFDKYSIVGGKLTPPVLIKKGRNE